MHVCSRREGRVLRKRLGDVVVRAINIVVLLETGQVEQSRGAGFAGPTLVRTLYSQLSTCCWTAMSRMRRCCPPSLNHGGDADVASEVKARMEVSRNVEALAG